MFTEVFLFLGATDTSVAAPTGTFSAMATNSDSMAQNPTGTPYTVLYDSGGVDIFECGQ